MQTLFNLFTIFFKTPESEFYFLEDGRIYFQDGVTPIMEGICNLHDDIFAIMIFVLGFVSWMLSQILSSFHVANHSRPSSVAHGTTIEIIWTTIPTLILVAIAFPTFALIYCLDEGVAPELTVKVIGHQWYWSYEYTDLHPFLQNYLVDGEMIFDSYIVQDDDLAHPRNNDARRLLEVDKPLILPVDTHIRLLVTSADVLHSWCIPSVGVKMDAVPGRLNQVMVYLNTPGVFYGQCSEICGTGHAFMPIKLISC